MPAARDKYYEAGKDVVLLEDSSGRIQIAGVKVRNAGLVTGCVIAVLGCETSSEHFEVIDICLAELPPQISRVMPRKAHF